MASGENPPPYTALPGSNIPAGATATNNQSQYPAGETKQYGPPPPGTYPGGPPPPGTYPGGPPPGTYPGGPPPPGTYPGQYPPQQYPQPPAGSYQQGGHPGTYGPPGYQPVPTNQQPSYMQSRTVIVTQPPSVVVVGGCPACRVGVLEDDFTCLGVCCAIVFFPLGILCCLAMRQRRCPNCGAEFG